MASVGIRDVRKAYGATQVIHGVSVDIQVVIPEVAAWLSEFEREITAFPNGRHDDQVDSRLCCINLGGLGQGDYLRSRPVVSVQAPPLCG